MKTRLLAIACLATVATAAEEVQRALPVDESPQSATDSLPRVIEPPSRRQGPGQDRVISNSGQFRVTGGENQDRAAIVMLAEEAKLDLLVLTEESKLPVDKRERWKVPVVIRLHGKSGDPLPARMMAMRLQVSEIGYEIILDVHLSRGIEHERFKRMVTAAVVYERTLRHLPASESEERFLVPQWLVEGLREATAWRLDLSDRRLYEALFKTGGLYKIDDVFAIDEAHHEDLDGAMRAAFRVSSGALVMALLQQPQGKDGFRAFLNEVAGFQGEMPALLRKHFPELNLSETSLSKWWALQLANIGGQNLATDVLSVSETEALLAEGLRLNFRTEEGIIQQKELAAWQEIASLPEPERANSVRLAQDAMVRLSYRCFPSYRPLLAEYQIVLNSIAKNETKDVPGQLAALEERRTVMVAKAARARDFMDLFEITRARETSEVFDDYMRLKERLKANPHRRTDDLSKYLDRLDAIFGRGLGKGPPPPEYPDLQNGTPEIPELPVLNQ